VTEEKVYDKSGITGAEFDDPNLDKDQLIGFDDESPYPEVRSAVANTDDLTCLYRLSEPGSSG